jgi:hypothetical protein
MGKRRPRRRLQALVGKPEEVHAHRALACASHAGRKGSKTTAETARQAAKRTLGARRLRRLPRAYGTP